MSKTIVCIEDEEALRAALQETLVREGFAVHTAGDGEEGARLVENILPDLVILDLVLPKLDGFAVLERIKNNQATKHIPVVVLTNLEGSHDVERVLAYGATTYLVKANYRLSEIMEKLKEILAHYA